MDTARHPIAHTGRYPSHLIDAWQLRDGTRVIVRPVLPQDDELLREFVAVLSPQSRRLRFHAPINGLCDAALARLTQLDYHHHLAFVVTSVSDGDESIVAEARYVIDADDPETADFAIAVADAWHGRGIGARLMHLLAAAARAAGLRWLRGEVLAGNATMLALMQRCGYCVAPHASDEALLRVETSLQQRTPSARRPWLARLATVLH